MSDAVSQDALSGWGTREKAVEFPHSMNVSAYLMQRYKVPRQWFQDDIIYHYTDAPGLLGIVKERTFWATKSSFLNDPTENTHAFDVVRSHIAKLAKGSDESALLAAAALPRIARPETDLYVTSFCRNGDLLSQWRGYGAFGAGYALGFSFPLGRAPHIQMAWLIEVLYNTGVLLQAVDETFSIFEEYMSSAPRERDFEQALDLLPGSLNVLWMGFKNAAYVEEQEVRLLSDRSSKPEHRKRDAISFGKVHYRTSKSDLIPYLKIGMSFPEEQPPAHLPLKRVVVGPGVACERNKEAIEQLLTDEGYEGVEIVASAIPFIG